MVANICLEPRDSTGVRNKFIENMDLISPDGFILEALEGEESEIVIKCTSFDKPKTL